MEIFAYTLIGLTLLAGVLYVTFASIVEEDVWSIGIYFGNDPLQLIPHPLTGQQPVLEAKHVTDAPALFVADPFLIRTDGRWLMFFEVLNGATNRGEIAYASSVDGIRWQYGQLVLREPFHLSYPQVFRSDDTWYMIPESAEAGGIRLYKADTFPTEWHCVAELLQGHYLDSTICRREDGWYLFTLRDNSDLALFCADRLTGPWTEHPDSPVAREKAIIRPAGPMFEHDARLLRFSQDGTSTYGNRVLVSAITTLTRNAYTELPHSDAPLIDATGRGWNADGMHQVDFQCVDNGWLAAVDGKIIKKRFRIRTGVRALLNRLGLSKIRVSKLGVSSLL